VCLSKLVTISKLVLNLDGNKIGDTGAYNISNGLKFLVSLSRLELSLNENSIGHKGIEHISNGL